MSGALEVFLLRACYLLFRTCTTLVPNKCKARSVSAIWRVTVTEIAIEKVMVTVTVIGIVVVAALAKVIVFTTVRVIFVTD